MEIINWTDKVSTEDVLISAGEPVRLVETVKSEKKEGMGHILSHERLEKELTEEKMKGNILESDRE